MPKPKKMERERVSVAEFARRIGMARQGVIEACNTGRLTKDADGLLDFEQAKIDWDANRRGPGRKAALGITDWANELKREQARKAKLERRELQGSLVRRDVVERANAELAVIVRDGLRQIGARLGAQLAAEVDPRKCREIVNSAIDKALVALADGGL